MVVPIVHFYGPKEVGYILRRTQVKAFITVDQFGHTNYLKSLPRMRDDMASVDLIGVVGLDAPIGELVPFADLLANAPMAGPVDGVDPAGAAIVAYTSGTTVEPKGVVHTH